MKVDRSIIVLFFFWNETNFVNIQNTVLAINTTTYKDDFQKSILLCNSVTVIEYKGKIKPNARDKCKMPTRSASVDLLKMCIQIKDVSLLPVTRAC